MYERLSEGVAGEEALLDLLMATPGEQRRPSLLFAAVSFLLEAHRGTPLAAYYPVHRGARRPTASSGRPLRTRSTQTNEIRRCLALRLGLSHVAQRWAGPLALAEAGASAGLTCSSTCTATGSPARMPPNARPRRS